ncbi:MAG: Uncharacterized UPF0721 integral membrane protein, partial [uncultured Nocardioides sp.]
EPDRGPAARPRRGGRRHHQRRGGVGDADHVPHPARFRGPPGDGQRLQQHRAGTGVRRRCPRLPPRAEGAGGSGSAPRDGQHRRGTGRRAAPDRRARRVRAHRARAGRARRGAGPRGPAHLGLGGTSPRGGRRPARAGRLVGVARDVPLRGVRRLLRRCPGRADDGRPRHRHRRGAAAVERGQERPGDARQPRLGRAVRRGRRRRLDHRRAHRCRLDGRRLPRSLSGPPTARRRAARLHRPRRRDRAAGLPPGL